MIEDIELRYIRSYQHVKIQLSEGINLFFGKNGAGKTTLLEAAQVMAATKSFKTSTLADLIQKGQSAGKITLGLKNAEKLALEIHPKLRKYQIGMEKVGKQSDFFGQFSTVVLAPEHMRIVESGKQERLRYLDQILYYKDPNYLKTIKDQQKVLTQKRALLKQGLSLEAYLDHVGPWDVQNQTLTDKIREKRAFLVKSLSDIFYQTYQEVADVCFDIEISYMPDDFQDNAKAEFFAKRVLCGAHRDDLKIKHADMEAKTHASQGEKATLLLSLKFAEVAYLEMYMKQTPVFLLDDIGTTLDQHRRVKLFSKLEKMKYQTLVTTCDPYIQKEIVQNQKAVRSYVYDQSNECWD